MGNSPYPTATGTTRSVRRCAGVPIQDMEDPTPQLLRIVTRSCRGTMSGSPCPQAARCLGLAVNDGLTMIAGGVFVKDGEPQTETAADRKWLARVQATRSSARPTISLAARDAVYGELLKAYPRQLAYAGRA